MPKIDLDLYNSKYAQSIVNKGETFEKLSVLFKIKAGKNFNHRHTIEYSED